MHISVKPSPIIREEISDAEILNLLKAENVIENPKVSEFFESCVTYFKGELKQTTIFVKVVDAGYGCYAEYSTNLQDLKAIKL